MSQFDRHREITIGAATLINARLANIRKASVTEVQFILDNLGV